MRIVLVSLLVMLLCFGVVDGEEHGRLRQRRVGDAGEGATETDVVVIGAGAAGLSAAYTLNRSGIDYIVLEATERLGGRTQKDTSFAPYPLDIGASWVQRPYAIEKIVNPDGIQLSQLMSNFICYDLSNFVNYTYHDFINDYIAPKERRKILFGCRVNVVNYSNAKVLTVCEDGRWFLSEHVVVTVPLAILNQNVIKFYPALPDRLTVNHPGWMFGGFKMAIEFAKGFRGRQICFPDIMEANGDCLNRDGESYMWPISSIHDEDLIGGNVIMLGYIVGKPAEQFLGWNDENKIIGRVLELLDPKFNYMASKLYVKHKIWNWSEMPIGAFSKELRMFGISREALDCG